MKALTVAKITWIITALALFLAAAITTTSPSDVPEAYRNEKLMLLGFVMIGLSFPSGLMWLAIVVGVDSVVGLSLARGGLTGLSIEWIGALVLGYLQWFWLLPRIVEKRRRSMS